MPRHEVDEDIFTLKEDESGRRRSQRIQYILVSTFAVLVIAVALYMSWWLTEQRLEYQTSIMREEEAQQAALGEETNYWPQAQFPDVPVLQSSVYDTRITQDHAEVQVPMSAADGFNAYITQLLDDGAKLYIDTQRLVVLDYKNIEMHLIRSSGRNAVVLCGEPQADWNESAYQDFPLPENGKLVNVSDQGTGERSRVLTYRQMSATDAIAYVSLLAQSDWAMIGTLEPDGHVFSCSFKKEDKQIAVDYFASSDNARVKLDFIQ